MQARGSHGRLNVIRLVPPMTCNDDEIDQGLTILRNVLRKASGSRRAPAA
jgi:4-aminobutyrate aminotransferase-like enzyme